jgi:hypothetical protein
MRAIAENGADMNLRAAYSSAHLFRVTMSLFAVSMNDCVTEKSLTHQPRLDRRGELWICTGHATVLELLENSWKRLPLIWRRILSFGLRTRI